MILRKFAALLALGLVAAAAPASASVAIPGNPVRVQLTIDYEPPPDPDFQGLELTGQAQFWLINDGKVPDGPPVDIGHLEKGQVFVNGNQPCGNVLCPSGFSFSGHAGGFVALAFQDGVPPDPVVPPDPIIPLGKFIPGNPVHASGPIFAWDAPVQVGTWSVSIAPVPEPGQWTFMLAGFAGLGLAARWRRAALAR
jgi:hypothetical protein